MKNVSSILWILNQQKFFNKLIKFFFPKEDDFTFDSHVIVTFTYFLSLCRKMPSLDGNRLFAVSVKSFGLDDYLVEPRLYIWSKEIKAVMSLSSNESWGDKRMFNEVRSYSNPQNSSHPLPLPQGRFHFIFFCGGFQLASRCRKGLLFSGDIREVRWTETGWA